MGEIEHYSVIQERQLWNIYSFDIVDEPLMKALLKYRRFEDREEIRTVYTQEGNEVKRFAPSPVNGVGSKLDNGKHMPIIDLDFPHAYVPSTTGDHAHLYLNVPISRFRWIVLMFALRFAKVIEPGYFLWSLRRGHNQVRMPGVEKGQGAERGEYTHGWFFKKRR